MTSAPIPTADALLGQLGPVEPHGELSFADAMGLQGSLYDDGSIDARGVFQAGKLSGHGGDWWTLIEPNCFRASRADTVRVLAGGQAAASYFWNVNAAMYFVRVLQGETVAQFDPFVDDIPEDGQDLPHRQHPVPAAFALLLRWTGVTITHEWYVSAKPTFVVTAPY